MYNYIIFDVDGTILDTEQALLKSLQHTLAEEQHHYELDELTFALGIPGKETLKQIGIADVERVHATWSSRVLDYAEDVSIFAGLADVIKELHQRSVVTGIVTSKTKQQLVDEFLRFQLHPYFREIVCADDTTLHKPNPEPLLLCLQKLQAPPQQAVYIGDSIYDMQCAHAAGTAFALAQWGANPAVNFDQAAHTLQQPADILALLHR